MRSLAVVALVVAGCYSPSYRDCEVTCGLSGVCPDGFTCASGVCRLGGASGPCGSGGRDAGSDANPTRLPVTDFFAAELDARCTAYVRCGVMEDVNTCRELIRGALSGSSAANTAAAVAAGIVIYDEQQALACLDGLAQLGCTRHLDLTERGLPAACRRIFAGTLDANEGCVLSEACISQSCAIGSCPPNTCCSGTCVGSAPPGDKTQLQTCTAQDHCIDGYCDLNPGMFFCRPYQNVGDFCTMSEECANGSYCRGDGTTSAQCVATVDTNGPCASTDDCARLSDVCTSGACQTGGLLNTPCTSATNAGCQLGHYCDSDGVCALPPGVGEPCDATVTACRGDAYCAGNQCVARMPDGSGCQGPNANFTCSSGYCNQATLRCEQPPICI